MFPTYRFIFTNDSLIVIFLHNILFPLLDKTFYFLYSWNKNENLGFPESYKYVKKTFYTVAPHTRTLYMRFFFQI